MRARNRSCTQRPFFSWLLPKSNGSRSLHATVLYSLPRHAWDGRKASASSAALSEMTTIAMRGPDAARKQRPSPCEADLTVRLANMTPLSRQSSRRGNARSAQWLLKDRPAIDARGHAAGELGRHAAPCTKVSARAREASLVSCSYHAVARPRWCRPALTRSGGWDPLSAHTAGREARRRT